VRVFLDTNVLASAFATRGICADVLMLVVAEHELVVSEQVLTELSRTLRERFRTGDALAQEAVEFLRQEAALVGEAPLLEIEVRDADDKRIVEQAVLGEADVLVTGDRDLTEMGTRRPVRILTPRGFWELLRADPQPPS
jgi:uncharacterized protein